MSAGDRISAAQLADVDWLAEMEPRHHTPVDDEGPFIMLSVAERDVLVSDFRAAWGETEAATRALRDLPTQADTLEWVRALWPERTTPIWRAAKLGEEAGEVLGAVIKMDEGRKTIDDLRMEAAQVVICAMALAESAGFNLFDGVAEEWCRVRALVGSETSEDNR